MSLAERRVPRKRQFPKRFTDFVPQPLRLLPPTSESCSLPSTPIGPLPSTSPSLSPPPVPVSRVLQTFCTPRNGFGLFRRYHSVRLPSHDPEESIELQDLINPVAVAGQTSSLPREANHTFYPFPNKNSFLLDNWYWNQGVQKSRNSLCDLLSVVGSPEFRPDDVRHTHWGKIDGILGRNDFDEDGEAGE